MKGPRFAIHTRDGEAVSVVTARNETAAWNKLAHQQGLGDARRADAMAPGWRDRFVVTDTRDLHTWRIVTTKGAQNMGAFLARTAASALDVLAHKQRFRSAKHAEAHEAGWAKRYRVALETVAGGQGAANDSRVSAADSDVEDFAVFKDVATGWGPPKWERVGTVSAATPDDAAIAARSRWSAEDSLMLRPLGKPQYGTFRIFRGRADLGVFGGRDEAGALDVAVRAGTIKRGERGLRVVQERTR
jgi:hypothetical protein